MTTVIAPPEGRISPMDGIGESVLKEDSRDITKALKGSPIDFEVAMVPHINPLTLKPEVGLDGKPKFFDVCRTDTKSVLGVVMGKYATLQNETVFGHIVPAFLEAGAKITRCSALDDGARCFVVVEWDEKNALSVVGDVVGCKGIIQTSHDGRWATKMVLYPERLACLNGMRVPIPIFKFDITVTHTVNGEDRLIDAQSTFRDASRYFDGFGRLATMLAKTKVTTDQANDMLLGIEGLKGEEGRQASRRAEIMNLFQGGQPGGDREPLKGSAYGWLNAVTEAADYGEGNSRIRLTAGQTEGNQRFKRAFDTGGTSAALKIRAFDRLLKQPDFGLGDSWKKLEAELKAEKKRDALAKANMN